MERYLCGGEGCGQQVVLLLLHASGDVTVATQHERVAMPLGPATTPLHFNRVRLSSVSVSAQDGIVALGKAHTRSTPSLSSLPQGCPKKKQKPNSASICLVEHSSFSTLEGGMSAASFFHSSFLQAINAVMLRPVHVQKVPQVSEHLCPAKLQTRCNICCACQSTQFNSIQSFSIQFSSI